MTRRAVRHLLVVALVVFAARTAFAWEFATPAEQGMDTALLDALTPRLQSGELGTIQGVMVVRGGQVVYLSYQHGYAGELHPVFSVTKSVGSILLGTLVRDGLLDVDSPLSEHFPEYPNVALDPLKRQITVEHVLQQRHGLDWQEWPYTGAQDHPIGVMVNSSDWIGTVLDWPMAGPPGETFQYSTGASGLMSGIVTGATGQIVQTYARNALFNPLGIGAVDWLLTGPYAADEDDFPDGNAPLGFGLWMTLTDMGRIGQMMLDGGVWDGRRIVTEDWIEASIEPYSNSLTEPEIFSAPGSGYGYQWWVLPLTDALGRTFDVFYADGFGRQYIFVIPQADLVVVQVAADYDYDGPGIGTGLREHILPAITEDPRAFEPMSARLNGSWSDPDLPGQGISLEILEDRNEALVYWFTYGQDGQQKWMVGQGPIDDAGTAHLEFVTTESGRFALPPAPELVVWGTAELTFGSCHAGRLLFESADEAQQGTIELGRLTGTEACIDPPAKHGID